MMRLFIFIFRLGQVLLKHGIWSQNLEQLEFSNSVSQVRQVLDVTNP